MDFTGKCFGLGGSGGVCCMFSLILGLGTLVLQAKQGNGFSTLPSRSSSPPPTSSGWGRALGRGETTAVVQHREQDRTARPLVPASPFNPRALGTAGRSTQPCLGERGSQGSLW